MESQECNFPTGYHVSVLFVFLSILSLNLLLDYNSLAKLRSSHLEHDRAFTGQWREGNLCFNICETTGSSLSLNLLTELLAVVPSVMCNWFTCLTGLVLGVIQNPSNSCPWSMVIWKQKFVCLVLLSRMENEDDSSVRFRHRNLGQMPTFSDPDSPVNGQCSLGGDQNQSIGDNHISSSGTNYFEEM